MVRKYFLLIILILSLVSSVLAVQTTITNAYISASCGSDLALISIEDTINAHGAVSTSYYANKLCVAGTGLANSATNGDHVIKLEQAINSEAQFEGNYTNPIYLGSTNANYNISCKKGDNGGTPIVGLSSDSAAHMAEDGTVGYTDAYCNVTTVGYPILNSATDSVDSSPDVRALSSTVTVTTNSSDNEGDSLTLYVCTTDAATSSGCTVSEFCNNTASSDPSCGWTASEARGTTVNWYSYIFDAEGLAASSNSIAGDYKVNTLPAITDIASDVPYTYIGGPVTFYCYVTDADNQSMTADFYLRTNGSASWDKVNGAAMVWNAGNSRFEYSGFDTSGEIAGQQYDAKCDVSDGLESSSYNETPTEFYITADYDADGVLDPVDSAAFNATAVTILPSNYNPTLTVTIDGDSNLTDPTDGVKQVEYLDSGILYVNVTHSFAEGPANWYDFSDDRFGRSESGALTVIAGLDGQSAVVYTNVLGSNCSQMQYCVGMSSISLNCGSGWVNITGTSTGDGRCYVSLGTVADVGVRDLNDLGAQGLIPELLDWLNELFRKFFGN